MGIVKIILKQLFLTPATNKFPAKYAPPSTIQFLDKIKKGKLQMTPPIPVPPDFRGKLTYHRDKCTGCRLCTKICPTKAIENTPQRVGCPDAWVGFCFCAQCTEICPVGALTMTDEFLLSNYDKYADELIVK